MHLNCKWKYLKQLNRFSALCQQSEQPVAHHYLHIDRIQCYCKTNCLQLILISLYKDHCCFLLPLRWCFIYSSFCFHQFSITEVKVHPNMVTATSLMWATIPKVDGFKFKQHHQEETEVNMSCAPSWIKFLVSWISISFRPCLQLVQVMTCVVSLLLKHEMGCYFSASSACASFLSTLRSYLSLFKTFNTAIIGSQQRIVTLFF